MSAAEKLRALDLGPGSIDDAELGTMGYDGLLELRDALPQIVAVVEAAEETLALWDPQSRQRRDPLISALVALDEKLS